MSNSNILQMEAAFEKLQFFLYGPTIGIPTHRLSQYKVVGQGNISIEEYPLPFITVALHDQ